MDAATLLLLGLVIAVGLVGIVVPVLPGLLLVWGAVGVWAVLAASPTAWSVFAIATVVTVASQVVKYLVPGRRLQRAGVPNRSLVLGGVMGIVGFFVVPVLGLFLGFVAGIYLAERLRAGTHPAAWASTMHALTAVGLSVLIELLAGLLVALSWLGGVFLLT